MAIAEHRLQIYLPKKDYQDLRTKARSQRKSMAQIIRDSLRNQTASDRERIRRGYEKIEKIIGLFSDGAGVAERHDEFLNAGRRWGKR